MVQAAEWRGELAEGELKVGQAVTVPLVMQPRNKSGIAVCPQGKLLSDKVVLMPGKLLEIRESGQYTKFTVSLETADEAVKVETVTVSRGNLLSAEESKLLARMKVEAAKAAKAAEPEAEAAS